MYVEEYLYRMYICVCTRNVSSRDIRSTRSIVNCCVRRIDAERIRKWEALKEQPYKILVDDRKAVRVVFIKYHLNRLRTNKEWALGRRRRVVLRVSRIDELNYKLNASSSIYVVLVTQTRSLIFVSLWVNGTEETHKYLCVSMTAQFVAPWYEYGHTLFTVRK